MTEPVVDGHLDLAELVTIFGRDLAIGAREARRGPAGPIGKPTVSLPDLERGGVAVVCATVTGGFLAGDVPAGVVPAAGMYSTPEEAEAQALRQIALYETWARQGSVRLLRSAADLEHHLELWREDRKPGLVLLMEGADPIVRLADLGRWWARGLRMIGLTYGDTAYGHGATGRPGARGGGLTELGRGLLEEMAATGFIWDISHLAEEGVWEGMAMQQHPRVCASHADVRALSPLDRNLSDEVIRAVADRHGVIGLMLYNALLEPRWRRDRSIAVTLGEHLRRHAEHIGALAGWSCVGIGSDLDGGFGLDETPEEIDTVADLRRVAAAVPAEAASAVLGGNWLRFLRASLPRSTGPGLL